MKCSSVKNAILVVLTLISVTGYGAEMADLIARLKKLEGKSTIQAAVHVEDRLLKVDDKDIKPLETGNLMITADQHTLAITVTGKVPDSRVYKEFAPFRAAELTHCAPHLVKELDGLKLIENRTSLYEGVACTRWHLKSEEKQKKSGVSVTVTKDVELYIDSHGYPLASVFRIKSKGGKLFFKFSAEALRRQHYRIVGNRFVIVYEKNETDINSSVRKEKRTITTTIELAEN